jgi:hypothetical protein
MDARSEELLRDRSDAKNYKFSSKTKFDHKGRTFYSKIVKNVEIGTKK